MATSQLDLLARNDDALGRMRIGDNEGASKILFNVISDLSTILTSPNSQRLAHMRVCSASLHSVDDQDLWGRSTSTQQAFFDRAFRVSIDDSLDCCDMNPVDCLASVLLFNTALALHRWGVESGKTRVLAHSQRLYDQVLLVTVTADVSNTCPLNPMLLATACNLEQLCSEFRDNKGVERARRIFDQFFSHTRFCSDEEQDFFLANKWQREFSLLPPAA